jgi:hypothetical protein
VTRYWVTAEDRLLAATKVVGVAAVLLGGLWLAVQSAPVSRAGLEEQTTATEESADRRGPTDIAERAARALAALEQSPSNPPADAVSDFLSRISVSTTSW